MSDHAGTHVDAFKHFGPGGTPIDEMPLEDFYTSAIALDLSHVELGASISVREMEEALEASGEEIKQGDTILVYMGFNKRVHFDEPRWQHCFPGLHPESVEWLADRGCGMFGESSRYISSLGEFLSSFLFQFEPDLVGTLRGFANLTVSPQASRRLAPVPRAR